MEKTIGRLLEIEEQAQTIISRANEEKIRLHEAFEHELTLMEKGILDQNTKKINDFKTEIDKQLENEENLLILKNKKQLTVLDETFQNNHDSLVNQVFESILHS